MSNTTAFSSLLLAEPLARAVADMGYESMTPIQQKAIPVVLQGRDVMGAAQTGTGKTAAFSLPLLQRLLPHENTSASPARHPVRALVLLPTRELADQVAQQIHQYAIHTRLRSTVVFGGMDMKPQTAALKQGVEVLVATPGRLLDHIEARNVVLNQVEYVVLDEADRMLDIGFLPDLQRILSYLPQQRVTLLFSATFSPEIKRLAASYLQDPVTIEVARSNATAATVEQIFYSIHDADKYRALKYALARHEIGQTFIFVNSRLGCARLARMLERDGYTVAALHGDKSQDERLKALEAFKSGEVRLLVCTDVAARGLDIKDVPAVFNYDIPFNAEDYVHRIGRTGRAGASGLAISFVTQSQTDKRLVADIAKLTRQDIQSLTLQPHEEERERGRGRTAQQGRRGDRAAEGDPRDGLDKDGKMPSDRRRSPPTRQAKPGDPLFDQPYEPAEPAPGDEVPAWEKSARNSSTSLRRGVSANIRPRRQVAALFRAPEPSPGSVPDDTR